MAAGFTICGVFCLFLPGLGVYYWGLLSLLPHSVIIARTWHCNLECRLAVQLYSSQLA